MQKIFLLSFVSLIACSSSKPKGEPQTIIGTVAVNAAGDAAGGQQQVLIEQLEFTRSKVSFEVSGSLKDQVAALKGKTITVKGNVIKHSPFSGSIEVTEILK